MQRIRAAINYPLPGSPGVITLYTRSTGLENGATAQLTCDRLRDAVTAGADLWAGDTHIISDAFVDDIDPATGHITGSNGVTGWSFTGTGATAYCPPATAVCIAWKTAAVIGGRRVQGRTFVGPLSTTHLQTDGTPDAGGLTKANDMASAWTDNGLTATFTVVWHRPVSGAGGTAEDITGHVVKDKFAVLRSRRD